MLPKEWRETIRRRQEAQPSAEKLVSVMRKQQRPQL